MILLILELEHTRASCRMGSYAFSLRLSMTKILSLSIYPPVQVCPMFESEGGLYRVDSIDVNVKLYFLRNNKPRVFT